MIPINRIFVDMDGVLADFVQGVQGPKYLNGPLTDHLYDDNKIELSNKGLFKDLPLMPGMKDLINAVKDTGVYWEILTCTGELNRKKVAQDKTTWIREHVDPGVVITCTFKGEQKAAYAKPGSILIDDRPRNIKAWTDAGGIGILHKNAADTIAQLQDLSRFLVA